MPPSSNLNFGVGATVAASAVVRLGSAGICAQASTDTHLIVDAMGTFVDQGGLDLQPVAPVRLVDTRAVGGPWEGRVGRGQSLPLDVSKAPGFPADAQAVVLNLTVTGAVDDGFASIASCSSGPTGTSNINFRVGKTVANTVLVGTSGGPLCLVSSGRAHVIVDVSGVFVGHQPVATPPLTVPPAEGSTSGHATAQEPAAQPAASAEPNLSPTSGGCAAAPGGLWFLSVIALLLVHPERARSASRTGAPKR